MNTIVLIAAWVAVGFSVLFFFAYPFQIGKPKTGEYNGWGFLQGIVECSIFVLLAGRVFGWW